jgi:prophage antirepressor-like protein
MNQTENRGVIMSNIIPFNYESQQIRVIQDEQGEPLWVAKDVCQILGLEDTHKAVERLDEDEKGRKTIPTLGGNQEMWVINEPGLYTLIIRSNKPDAKKFKRWITHEVLPSIRKTGSYEVGTLSEIDLIIKSAQALKQIELKQIDHDNRLTFLEVKSYQNSGHTGYWTISAWCKLNNLMLTLDEANRKGRESVKLSREWCVEIGKVRDERFGEVNSYREDVLEEIFSLTEVCS